MVATGRSKDPRYAYLEDLIAAGEENDWPEPPKPKRDWKKIALVVGLGSLSWVATYVGMLELIQANMGELSLLHKLVVGFSVAMLMTMIVWLLDQMFAPLPLTTKAFYVIGYLFLTLISVGFGFGFYWKVLESRSEASRSATSAISQVQAALFAASSRLDQLQTTLGQLQRISTEKAVIEREKGTSCPNSRPGDGPRRKLRDADAARFAFASEFVKGRGTKVKENIRGLDVDLKKITTGAPSTVDPTTGTRNEFLEALTRKLELTATGFNAFRTDPQLRQIRSELAERSTQTVFPTGQGRRTFSCPDPQLQSALRGVVRAIDQLPELGKPKIATVEGAGAVVEAFRRLIATLFGALSFKLPPSADELRALQQKAVQSVENAASRQAKLESMEGGLSKRDYIPLAIAAFVDLCLLLVSIGRPMNRLNNLLPKMREAEHGPVFQILSRFDDIHKDDAVRGKFEIFRHVVFDFNGDYYVAVPLAAPEQPTAEKLEQLQLEAHLLGNLFASFEKERIFSRVYNPLLSRKMIENKLQRQGSKFAHSSAFRVYRFRDGAWSDFILGAVMGAARQSGVLKRRAAMLNGPSLDVPAEAHPAGAPNEPPTEAPMPAPHVPDAPAGPEADVAVAAARKAANGSDQTIAEPFDLNAFAKEHGETTTTASDDLRAKYGPYADKMLSLWLNPNHAGRAEVPGSAGAGDDDTGGKDAEADQSAANNNTSPSRRSRILGTSLAARLDALDDPDASADGAGNVIPLPGPRSQMPTTASAEIDGSRDIELHDPVQLELIPSHEMSAEPVRGAAMPLFDVRLTERTADVSLPAALLASLNASLPRSDSVTAPTTADRSPNKADGSSRLAQISEQETPSADIDDAKSDRLSANGHAGAAISGRIEQAGEDFDPFLKVAERFARAGVTERKE